MHAQAGRAAHQLLDGLELDDAGPGIQSAEAQMGLIRNRCEELQEERVKRLRVHVRARVLPVLLVAAVDFLWLRGWLLAVMLTVVSRSRTCRACSSQASQDSPSKLSSQDC